MLWEIKYQNNKIKIVSIIFLIIILLMPPLAESSTGIPSPWAVQEVENAYLLGLIPPEISLGYQENITRKEFCLLVMNLIKTKTGMTIPEFLEYKGTAITPGIFTDTDDEMILAANALGIVQGIGGGLFNPNGNIQRQQAATMLYRAALVLGFDTPNDISVNFADRGLIAHYAIAPVEFISACSDRYSNRRVMGGVGQNQFSPTGPYTREQAILTMLRLFNSFDYHAEPALLQEVTPAIFPLYIESIEGTYMQGHELTAGAIIYSEEPPILPSVSWQWLRGDTADGIFYEIPGATSNKYRTTAEDANKYINVAVTVSGSAEGIAISFPVLIEPFSLILAPFKPLQGFYPVFPDGTHDSPFSGGKGIQSEPYIITTAEQFLLLQSNTIDTYFKLGNNITLGHNQTITENFYGHLDGNKKTITINTNNGQGLFNMIASGASVKDLIVTGKMTGYNLESHSVGRLANLNYGAITSCASITTDNSIMFFSNGINVRVGGLVGRNFGIISECYSTGNIRLELEERRAINGHYPSLADMLISDWNRGWAGGLVGVNMAGGIIRNCYSRVNVYIHAPGELSYGISGGLLSSNLGTVQNCYSAGSVSKNKYRGGLIGYKDKLANVENSYYDKETSGRNDNEGRGIPKTTTDMKRQSTFAGWSTSIWRFYSDFSSYPTLRWQ